MIISKYAEVGVNVENRDRLEQLGYIIPKYYNKNKKKYICKRGTKILVKIEDLAPSCHSLVTVQCDYCGKMKTITYRDYIKSLSILDKYACSDCGYLKKRELIKCKQDNGLLNKTDKGYWYFKENRLKELDLYIQKYQTLHGMQNNKEGANIYSIFTEYNDSIKNACIELEYDYASLLRFEREESYYDNYLNLKNDIEILCNELGRFPTQKEVLINLHIANTRLLKFGGILQIKTDMKYDDKNDLVDDRGYYNKSAFEYITAQYLIKNNISYEREVHPFKHKHKNYRSDFTIYPLNKPIIHIEVWGVSRRDNNSERSILYNKKRIVKEQLYNEYNYILIGLDYEIFNKSTYTEIQEYLYDKFKNYIDLEHKYIENKFVIPPSKVTDIELLNMLLEFSTEENMLPKESVLDSLSKGGLYLEAIKRYGSYYNFARHFDKFTYYQYDKWDKQSILDCFIYMLNKYGHFLKNEEYKKMSSIDRNLTGLMEGVKKVYKNFIDARLEFYQYCLDNYIQISDKDIEYLNNLINIRNGFNRKTATIERINIAEDIIRGYYRWQNEVNV